MKLTKKLMALILCVLMVASVLPAGVVAEESDSTVDSTVTEEQKTLPSNFHLEFPFDDAEGKTAKEYVASKTEGTEFAFRGKSDSTALDNYGEESGNKYLNVTEIANNGFAISHPTAFEDRIIEVSLRIRLSIDPKASLSTGEIYFPIIRFCEVENVFSGSDVGKRIANALMVKTGKQPTDGSARSLGSFIYTTNSGAGSGYDQALDYEVKADTWYDIKLVYDTYLTKGTVTIDDGTSKVTKTVDAMNLPTTKAIAIGRGYDKNYLNFDLDDLVISDSISANAFNDFNDLTTAEGATAPTAIPALGGFSKTSGSISKWTLTTEEDGNKYLTLPYVKDVTAPLTWTIDTTAGYSRLLNQGPFEVSFDFKYAASSYSSPRGMYSVYVGDRELRIINMDGSGNLHFGPGTAYPIAQLTTGASAQWHNIKTVFVPTGSDMCYRFYVDNELVAYSDIVIDDDGNSSYCYYTNASGEWVTYEDVVGGIYERKCATTVEEFEDTVNFNGKWDAAEPFTDTDENGKWDEDEKYTDSNGNGQWDDAEPFTDHNDNGVWDSEEPFTDADKDGKYDSGEEFVDINGNGKRDVYSLIGYASQCSWGTSKDNNGRTPVGFWDGQYELNSKGEGAWVNRDGVIDTITKLYMFHYNQGGFSFDNLTVKRVVPQTIDFMGYQLNKDRNAIRLVAGVYDLNCERVGIDIDIFDPVSNKWVNKVSDQNKSEVYTSLIADEETVTARSQGAPYMIMLAIKGIDTSALMRVTPYTMMNGVKSYDDSTSYLINPKSGVLTPSDVIKLASDYQPEVYIQDFADGLNFSGSGDGYSTGTWALLSSPNKDIRWGGESFHTASSGDGYAIISPSFGVKYYLASDTSKTTTTSADALSDADGNPVIKSPRSAGRVKFAHVIPSNIADYKGQTIVITARIQAREVGVLEKYTATVEGKEYAAYKKVVDKVDDALPDSKTATINFGFMNDSKTYMVGSSYLPAGQSGNYNSYTISVSEKWFEVTATLQVTDSLVEMLKSKGGGYVSGTENLYPLRPVVQFGNSTDGYLGSFFIDDITCYIIPTAN